MQHGIKQLPLVFKTEILFSPLNNVIELVKTSQLL